jgi:two-component system, OmpR family, KDP operon response regulator KdpE
MPESANSVLVIDDELQIRRFVSTGLELHGYTVKEAATGAAGLCAAAHMQPDVIVLDLGLPDMSGIEVLESVRAWSNVPIIVLSIDSGAESDASQAGRGRLHRKAVRHRRTRGTLRGGASPVS